MSLSPIEASCAANLQLRQQRPQRCARTGGIREAIGVQPRGEIDAHMAVNINIRFAFANACDSLAIQIPKQFVNFL